MPPLLLLDVDGVLNPYAAETCPAGYDEFPFFPDEQPPIRLCQAHVPWLRELGESFEIVWATGWQDEANRLLAPVLGLPRLAYIQFPPAPFQPWEKVPAIAAYAGDRPAAWIDDALTPQARTWAAERAAPTLLVDIDPALGLTRPAVECTLAWAALIGQ